MTGEERDQTIQEAFGDQLTEIFAQLQALDVHSKRKQCPEHDSMASDVAYIKKNQDIVGSDFKSVKRVVESISGKVDGMVLSFATMKKDVNGHTEEIETHDETLYGQGRMRGLAGQFNVWRGGVIVIGLLLTFLLGIANVSLWKMVDQIGAVHSEVTEHSKESAHPVMEERYKAFMKEWEEHEAAIERVHPDRLGGE